jgi:hypothetical protein
MPSPNLTNNPFTCLPNYIPSMGVFGLLDYPLCEDGDLTNNPFGCESAKGVSIVLSFQRNKVLSLKLSLSPIMPHKPL